MCGSKGIGDPKRLSLASVAVWLKLSVLVKASRVAYPEVSGLEALAWCWG